MSLDVLFRSIGSNICRPCHPELPTDTRLLQSLQACDPSEATVIPATTYLDSTFADPDRARFSRAQTPLAGIGSRAQTPLMVGLPLPGSFPTSPPQSTRPSIRMVGSPTSRSSNTPTYATTSPSVRRPIESYRQSKLARDSPNEFTQLLSVVPEESSPREPWLPPSKTTVWDRLSPKRTRAKTRPLQDALPHARRPPRPRPSTFAQEPNMASYATLVDPHCDYAVIVSMYEVYNDRIFDLLSTSISTGPTAATRQGAALQRGMTRRALLFKHTEMSPDRKVVVGLKKILCSNYEEAMMVLEAGLLERSTAGTSSNSVSSRSHGFFCIEVKKKARGNDYAGHHSNLWKSATLSIVDLAGSERARNAKTTGSALAEGGKINESLMYLGQCLQVQSGVQQDGTKTIVPWRHCKLTELLFSNSFPSSSNGAPTRPTQRGVMIVTADPEGDFNATSQILRYSALAREVTVPRIPSVTSVMGVPKSSGHSERNTPLEMPNNYFSAQELEQAQHEINRLVEETESLVVRLTEEEIKRTEAELKLQAAEDSALVMEQEVREECWQEMETMLEQEKKRWRAAWDEERANSQEFIDEKIEILEKNGSFEIHQDTSDKERVEELERENNVLRAKLAAMEQEMQTKSPTKKRTVAKTPAKKASKQVLEETTTTTNILTTNPFLAKLQETEISLKPTPTYLSEETSVFTDISPRKLTLRGSTAVRTSVMATSSEENLPPQTPGTTKKKTRKLTTRKWDLGEDEF